ncbi:MAG: MauE/DoxX family redox-associated membrane protein [Opitutaceae bacterium]
MRLVAHIVRLALAALFVAAAIVKIADPAAFHDAIRTYRVLPAPLTAVVALWLPWLELCAGLALLWPRQRTAALWLILALTMVFLGALGQAAWRELDIVCGCFGRPAAVRGAAYLEYLGRDVALLLVTTWLLRREGSARPPAAH